MGNTLTTCSCCENRMNDAQIGSIWIQDHFQILKRMPARAEVQPLRYEKKQDEEESEKESEKNEEEEEQEEEGERSSTLGGWLRGLVGAKNSNDDQDSVEKDKTATKQSTGLQGTQDAGPYQQFQDEDDMEMGDMNEYDDGGSDNKPTFEYDKSHHMPDQMQKESSETRDGGGNTIAKQHPTDISHEAVSPTPIRRNAKDYRSAKTLSDGRKVPNDATLQTGSADTVRSGKYSFPKKIVGGEDATTLSDPRQTIDAMHSAQSPSFNPDTLVTETNPHTSDYNVVESKPFVMPVQDVDVSSEDDDLRNIRITTAADADQPNDYDESLQDMRMSGTALPDFPELSPNHQAPNDQNNVPAEQELMEQHSRIDAVSEAYENMEQSEPGANADESFGAEPGLKLGLPQPAEDEDDYQSDSSEPQEPKNEEELAREIDGMIGGFMRKQKALAAQKGLQDIEKCINAVLIKFQIASCELVNEKMRVVNGPGYLEEKQKLLNQWGVETGTTPQRARVEEYEFLRIMQEAELQTALLAMLPIIKVELNNPVDRCKYMIGTQGQTMLIKNNSVMVRVGGGFTTLEDYIKQNGPFECIKIYKLMKGDEVRKTLPMSFKDAVTTYLKKLKAADKVIKSYLNVRDDEQLALFESAIGYLKEKQDQKNARWNEDAAQRRGTVAGKGSPRNAARGSPRNTLPAKAGAGQAASSQGLLSQVGQQKFIRGGSPVTAGSPHATMGEAANSRASPRVGTAAARASPRAAATGTATRTTAVRRVGSPRAGFTGASSPRGGATGAQTKTTGLQGNASPRSNRFTQAKSPQR